MKALFIIALGLLGLTCIGLLELELRSPGSHFQGENDLELIMFSQGQFAPIPQEQPFSHYQHAHGLYAGTRFLASDHPGLQIAVFDQNYRPKAFKNFEVQTDPIWQEKLWAWLNDLPQTCVVTWHHWGSIKAQLKPPLAKHLAEMGMQADPFQSSRGSWCFASLRLNGHWTPLAEVYSDKRATSLTYSLPATLDTAPAVADTLTWDNPIATPVDPAQQFAHISHEPKSLEAHPAYGSPAKPAIVFWNAGRNNRVAWRQVALYPNARLTGWYTSRKPAKEPFKVLVDNRVIAQMPIQKPGHWEPFEVDLSPYAGRDIDLEFQVPADAIAASAYGGLALKPHP